MWRGLQAAAQNVQTLEIEQPDQGVPEGLILQALPCAVEVVDSLALEGFLQGSPASVTVFEDLKVTVYMTLITV